MWNYLVFLCKSKNEHGVHSPFVFQYLTKGLYKRRLEEKSIQMNEKWLMYTLDYFSPKSVYWYDHFFNQLLNKWKVVYSKDSHEADVLIFNLKNKQNIERVEELVLSLQAHQILLLIHCKEARNLVKKLKRNPNITLTLDFFDNVLVSKRIEQKKQNFNLRF